MLERTQDALTTLKSQKTHLLAPTVQKLVSRTEFAPIVDFMMDVR